MALWYDGRRFGGVVELGTHSLLGEHTPVQFVDVDGCRVAHMDAGQGETIVFLHGISATLDYWGHNLPYFARSRRAIAPDLLGFGRSDKPDLSYTMPCMADQLDRFLTVKGVARSTLVGNSLGALLAVVYALSRPHRVERLVLVNAAGFPWYWRRLLRLPIFVGLRALYAMEHFPVSVRPPLLAFRVGFRWAFPTRPDLARQFARAYALGARTHIYRAHLRSFMRAFDGVLRYPVHKRAPGIGVPTLLIWGGRDLLLRPRAARRLARAIPDSRLIVYEDSGHCPMLDQTERFNRDLEQFLDSTPV